MRGRVLRPCRRRGLPRVTLKGRARFLRIMSQFREVIPRLTRRQDSLILALYVYGQSRLARFQDDFKESKDTLRRDLSNLTELGYVEIDTEYVGGSANDAHLYSLTSKGTKYAHTISVTNSDMSVLNRLDELEKLVGELRAENEELRQSLCDWTDSTVHYQSQLVYFAEQEGYPIESWGS